jgi:hypothetical protein
MRLVVLLIACGPGVGVYSARYDLEHAGCCLGSCFSSASAARISLQLERGGRATLVRERTGFSVVSGAREAGLGDRMEGAPQRDAKDLAGRWVESGSWWRLGRTTLVKIGQWRLRCLDGDLTVCTGAKDRGFDVCGTTWLDTRPGLVVEQRSLGLADCPGVPSFHRE